MAKRKRNSMITIRALTRMMPAGGNGAKVQVIEARDFVFIRVDDAFGETAELNLTRRQALWLGRFLAAVPEKSDYTAYKASCC